MNWFARPFGKNAMTPDAPHALLAEIDNQGMQYLDEADNGKWIYPACRRAPPDSGADKEQIGNHTRLEAMRYLLMVPRGEFRLLAEPRSQAAILEAYLRQLPHDETVIDFTGNTMSDLAIAVIAGFNWLTHCAGCRRRPQDIFGDAQSLSPGRDVGPEMVGDGGRRATLRAIAASGAGAAAVPVSGLGGLRAAGERDRRGACGAPRLGLCVEQWSLHVIARSEAKQSTLFLADGWIASSLRSSQ